MLLVKNFRKRFRNEAGSLPSLRAFRSKRRARRAQAATAGVRTAKTVSKELSFSLLEQTRWVAQLFQKYAARRHVRSVFRCTYFSIRFKSSRAFASSVRPHCLGCFAAADHCAVDGDGFAGKRPPCHPPLITRREWYSAYFSYRQFNFIWIRIHSPMARLAPAASHRAAR